MKNILKNNIPLVVLIILVFLTVKANIPKVLPIISIIIVAFYYFPIKIITEKNDNTDIISNIIISASVGLLVVGLYSEYPTLFAIFGIINSIFMFYLVFKGQEKKNYASTIIKHILTIALIALVM